MEHVTAGGTRLEHRMQEQMGSGPIYLHRCIGKMVIDIDVEDLRLSLTLDGGDVLHILSDLGPYEAGQITRNDKADEASALIVF